MISAPSFCAVSCSGDEVAQALAHLAARAVDREAVRQQAAVRRVAFDRAGDQQRRVEPAAVLVVAFEVEVGLGAAAVVVGLGRARVAAAQHVEEGRAGVEPDVEDVVALGVVRPSSLGAEHVVGASAATRPRRRPASTIAAARSISASVSGCSSPVSLCRKNGSGTPQLRWRLMHQSGRLRDHVVQPGAAVLRDRSRSARSRRARVCAQRLRRRVDGEDAGVSTRRRRPCARTTAPRRGRSPASCGASSAGSCARASSVANSRPASRSASTISRRRLPDVQAAEQRQRRPRRRRCPAPGSGCRRPSGRGRGRS